MNVAILPRRRGRPPKALAGFSETREGLLRVGVAALTEKGLSSTGIEEILKELGVPKGSFYHYFGSKEAFGFELIDHYSAYFSRRLDRFLLDESRSPLDRLRAFTTDAELGMKRYAFTRGCLIGNLGQEIGALPEGFRRKLLDVFADWEQRVAACLRSAQAAGEIGPELDCDRLASFFWVGWEGAILRAKLQRSAEPLHIFAEGFLALLSS